MGLKGILVWLTILLVCVLIVIYLIYSGNLIRENENSDTKIIRLVPSDMHEEYQGLEVLYKSCKGVEIQGESQGTLDMKKDVCEKACKKRSMKYYSDKCEEDLLVCLCNW